MGNSCSGRRAREYMQHEERVTCWHQQQHCWPLLGFGKKASVERRRGGITKCGEARQLAPRACGSSLRAQTPRLGCCGAQPHMAGERALFGQSKLRPSIQAAAGRQTSIRSTAILLPSPSPSPQSLSRPCTTVTHSCPNSPERHRPPWRTRCRSRSSTPTSNLAKCASRAAQLQNVKPIITYWCMQSPHLSYLSICRSRSRLTCPFQASTGSSTRSSRSSCTTSMARYSSTRLS